LTGCLPIFLQLPVFFGLFNMIQNAITLRHQPFLLWVRDLAAPDAAHFGGGVVVNVLPILMVVTWVVQQKMMPKPQDPQQQATYKMMMFMPIIFGFMLYNFASGMSLYWLTSTLLAIVEQKAIKAYIRKHHSAPLDLPESLVEEAAAAGAPVGEEEADAEAVVEGGRPPALKRPPKRRGGRRRR
jgi:membrane protein insertase Oxa1/YidC/SpoIIIJ